MDPAPWNTPFRFDRGDFLGIVAIPLSGGGSLHYVSFCDTHLGLQTAGIEDRERCLLN